MTPEPSGQIPLAGAAQHPVLAGIANSPYARVGAPSAIMALLVWITVQIADLRDLVTDNRDEIHVIQTWREVHTAIHERDKEDGARTIHLWEEARDKRDDQHKADREAWLEGLRGVK